MTIIKKLMRLWGKLKLWWYPSITNSYIIVGEGSRLNQRIQYLNCTIVSCDGFTGKMEDIIKRGRYKDCVLSFSSTVDSTKKFREIGNNSILYTEEDR